LVSAQIAHHDRIALGEQHLEEIFGDEYTAYRSRVKRWIPGVW
jgi:protein-S-isoprenylcysteine O-methyltransferase Ste14